jgi:uncharacterized protein YnzC (UPF0291/DUF896 family)
MERVKIARINELAKKKKTIGLTPDEAIEQTSLRKQYLDEFRAGFSATLDNVFIRNEDGTIEKLAKKPYLN